MSAHGPLEGYRVLELGSFIAAPTACKLFAEFGADVIKVERPGLGDEVRRWRLLRGEDSLVWATLGRNKRSVTLDLRRPEGRDLALRLIATSDVVVENFRAGTLERWGLGPDVMKEANPDLIVVRISGYGQTGPYRDRAGFGGIAEAMGGLRNLTGYPDRPPTRVGVSLGDTVAGMLGVIGALMCLLSRERAGFQVIDVALYEAVMSLLESVIPEYDGYGVVRERTGNSLPGVAPSNTYLCKGDKWVVIGGNGDAIFKRLMQAIGRPDLAEHAEMQDNPGRVRHQKLLDDVIEEWTSQRTLDEVMSVMVEASVPAGPIYDASDMVTDPHFESREMLSTHDVEFEPGVVERVRFPGVVPKLSGTPGAVRWIGPKLGEHNDAVYRDLLGMDEPHLQDLERKGII